MGSVPKPQSRRWIFRALVVLVALATLTLLGARKLGRWLVVTDPLKSAHAILVLSGGLPFRAMEGAKLYREGWAPEVWVTHAEYAEEEAVMKALGLEWPGEDLYTVEVLEKLGVPSGSIRVLPKAARNTAEEEIAALDELQKAGGSRIIIVTSRPHTRRTKAIWHTLVGDSPEAIVRPTSEGPFDSEHWWRTTRDVDAVAHECLGLINVWLGFPARPGRR